MPDIIATAEPGLSPRLPGNQSHNVSKVGWSPEPAVPTPSGSELLLSSPPVSMVDWVCVI